MQLVSVRRGDLLTCCCSGAAPAAGLAASSHVDSNAEVQFPSANGDFTMLAKRAIKVGEEVRRWLVASFC